LPGQAVGLSLYNHAVSHRPSAPQRLPAWARLAVFFSFLAVLLALVAPLSMLAEEVRTGQLGGICSANAVSGSSADASSGNASQAGAQCDLCVALGWALLRQPVTAIPSFAGVQVATADFPADVVATNPGLPFSRGPPARLT